MFRTSKESWLVLLGLMLAQFLLPAILPAAGADEDVEFFERRIRPVLAKHCYECHSEDSDDLGGGLLLDSRQGTLKGGDSGAALVAGEPAESMLLSAIEYRDFEMPPDGKLPDDVIADFRRWIRMGAPDPRDKAMPEPGASAEQDEAEPLWSLQPVARPEPPAVENTAWPRTAVDHFILAELEQAGFQPVGDATPAALLRRVSFDLIGLPPSPEALAAFEADPSREAFAQLVDRMLASPQFGQRWARHWFDVVRYAESAGNSRDVLMPHAWRYRDYVIDALNDDMPYDRFLHEQIAGDLLAAQAGEDIDANERDRLQVATGLLAIGSKSLNGGNIELDLVDDQIDVIGKAVLGMTIACARCHDHKFDPIPTADYYALAGIFKSTETYYGGGIKRPKSMQDKLKVYLPHGVTDAQVAEVQEVNKKTTALEKQKGSLTKKVQQLRKKLPDDWRQQKESLLAQQDGSDGSDEATDAAEEQDAEPGDAENAKPTAAPLLARIQKFEQTQEQLRSLQQDIEALKKRKLPDIQFAVGVREAKKIADSPIHIRGERGRTSDVVPRGFLGCVEGVDAPAIGKQSGRLELARWLTDPQQPLTPRVIVNRVWQHLFGRGLVESVNNFGVSGSQPTHPELLDYLASRFVDEHQWSLKSLIRELTLSRTYGLATTPAAQNYEKDPANKLYWRMSRRRLEAESLRDAMLANSGELRLEPYSESIVTRIGEGEVGRGINTKPLAEPFLHRAVYLPVIRGMIPEFLQVFDLPEPSNPQGQRDVTNVPAQSLYLMNSPFVIARAEALAKRLLAMSPADGAVSRPDRLQRLFQTCLARDATAAEIKRCEAFLDDAMQPTPDSAEADSEGSTDAGGSDSSQAELTAWTMLCQSIFASSEYRFLE